MPNVINNSGILSSASGFFVAPFSKDEIAALLQTSPEALEAFEKSYHLYAVHEEPDGIFSTNSRQAAQQNHQAIPISGENPEELSRLEDRIVKELLAQTEVYDSERAWAGRGFPALPDAQPVTLEEIETLPLPLQPQLSGQLMQRDIQQGSSSILLWEYKEYMESSEPVRRKMMYDQFRQGLDTLDLDPLTYAIIGTNPNSMGHWLPQLVEANADKQFFKIPKTRIVKVPITLLQLTRQEYSAMTPTTLSIIDKWAYQAFSLDESKEYFIKTGAYSSKFDFRNAHVAGAKEVRELGEYLLYIHFQALQMASFLCTPCIYGVSTTNEWVVREWIPDKENNPCIYHGLPLHTEYRIFIDCDTKEVLGMTPYWEPETMKNRFSHGEDADSPHQIHDYIIYKAHESALMKRYEDNIQRVVGAVKDLLPDLNLHGQWSLDIMQNGDDFCLIDMALAENSAFYRDCVPERLRAPTPENWLPKLPEPATE